MLEMAARTWQSQGVRTLIAAVTALLLAGCVSHAPPPVTPSASPTTKRTQEFRTTLTMGHGVDHTVGKDAEKTYGWADYSGRVRLLNNRFQAQLHVANDYLKGNGTFEGFMTLESSEGDIGLRVTGVAGPGPYGEGSAISGEAEIIGGTARYETLAGRGLFTGERPGDPGSPVSVVVTLELIDAK